MKFWASLTSHQFSSHYFTVARSVIFVAPDERLEALEAELGHLSSSGHSLRFTSWRELLGRLEQAQEQEQSTSTDARLFTGALLHLKEFCQATEQDHFVPFTTEQLQSPAEDGYTEHLVVSVWSSFQLPTTLWVIGDEPPQSRLKRGTSLKLCGLMK